MSAYPPTGRCEINVWINGRFIDRPITGVERVAHEFLTAIATEHLDAEGIWHDGHRRYRFRLIAPKGGTAESPWPNLPLTRRGRFGGHLWEQIDLPAMTAGDWLVNLCNTGPMFKRRQLVYLHDAQPFAIPQNFALGFRLWYRLLFHVIGRTSAQILTNSEFTMSELARRVGLNRERMVLCYPGSEHAEVKADSEQRLGHFRLPQEPFLLAVASSNPNKNFDCVLAALELLGAKAPPCVVVGRRDQGHFGSATVDPQQLVHLGYVSDDELLALYSRALCLVAPSHYEGFGLPPLEAMAVGCPAIVSDGTALKEIAGPGGVFCDPRRPASLAAAIDRLQSDPAYRSRAIAYGHVRCRRFSWESGGSTILNVLSQQVAGAVTYRRLPSVRQRSENL